MTSKVKGTEGIEFPDGSVQGSAAYSKAESDGPVMIGGADPGTGTIPGTLSYTLVLSTSLGFSVDEGSKYRPSVAGYYQVNMNVRISCASAPLYLSTIIRKNGANVAAPAYGPYSTTFVGGAASALVYMNGTTDYFEFVQDLGGTPSTPLLQNLICSANLVRRA